MATDSLIIGQDVAYFGKSLTGASY